MSAIAKVKEWLGAGNPPPRESEPDTLARRQGARLIRARHDAAQSTDSTAKHWAVADSLAADADLSPAVRKLLRNRARHETQNNSYAAGIIATLANDTIGPGPSLQVDHARADQIERAWREWATSHQFAQRLWTMRATRAVDGEAFAVLIPDAQPNDGVSLDLRLIDAERVTAGLVNYVTPASDSDVDGVGLDAAGRPVRYRVLREHPGNYATSFEADLVPASRMLHLFLARRPEQHRGTPEIEPALNLFAQLRRYTAAVLDSAETCANIAAVMTMPGGINEATTVYTPGDSLEVERNSIMAMAAGYEVHQLRPEQPSTTYADFKSQLINEIARCLSMPFNIAAGNSSGYNYASSRMDHQMYFQSIAVDQATQWAPLACDKVFGEWWDQYRLTDRALMIDPPPPHRWDWKKPAHVDPTKESRAASERLKNGSSSPQREAAALGYDWEDVLQERLVHEARERELRQSLGLPATEDPANGEDRKS